MKSFLPTKLNLDNDQIGKALEKAANPQRVNDDFIAPAAADSNEEQANDDTFFQTERMRSEAETVQKLPKTFPIKEWEKMTTKQQKKALEFSGLTEQEQWKILNVGAPLNALAHYPTRMYAMTDAKTNSGGPLKLEKTSTDDQEPRTTTPEYVEEAVSDYDYLYKWLEDINVDTDHLTSEQKEIIEDALQLMNDMTIYGTLTDEKRRRIALETGNKIANEAPSPNTDYLIYIEPLHQPGSIEDQAHRDLYGWVESLNLDTGNLTAGQRKILDDAEKRMVSLAELGILTDAVKRDILIKTGNQIAALPSSAENPITIFVETAEKPEQAPASVLPTKVQEKELTEEEKAIEAAKEINKQFKQEVYVELLDLSNETSRKGDLKKKINMDLVNKAAKVLYEKSSKPIPVGKVPKKGPPKETIPIGELVSPYDDSLGAQLLREAFNFIGIGYHERFVYDLGGNRKWGTMDCQLLVGASLAQLDKRWADVLGSGEQYQINRIKKVVWNRKKDGDDINHEDLQPGDVLYWKNNITDEIVHTALYINKYLMIEAGKDGVIITDFREETKDSSSGGSTLEQANRFLEEELNAKAD